MITNGFTIEREDGTFRKHSITDFNLAIGNNNYIGDPVQEIFKVDIAGGGILDLSEAITGMPVFKNREINIECGSKRVREEWDAEISNLRNMYEGQVCKITFDNDTDWYWTGRVHITDFDRKRELGTFNVQMDANAYKYNTSNDWEEITSTSVNVATWDFPIADYFTELYFKPISFHQVSEEGYEELFSYKFGDYDIAIELYNDSSLTQRYGTYESEENRFYTNKLELTIQEKWYSDIGEEWRWKTLQTQEIRARGDYYHADSGFPEQLYDVNTMNENQRLIIKATGDNLAYLGDLTVGSKFLPNNVEEYGYGKYIGSVSIIFNGKFYCKKLERSL